MEFNTLTLTLKNFVTALGAGYGRLTPQIQYVLAALAAVEIVLFGLGWALGSENWGKALWKVCFLTGWGFVVTNWATIARNFVFSLADAGLIAGGMPGRRDLLLDPSAIAGLALDVTKPLTDFITRSTSWFTNAGLCIIYGVTFIVVVAAFFIMAAQIMLAVIEFYVFLAVSGILMPFIIFKHTRFLAEKAMGAIVSCGVKLMTLTFLLAITQPLLATVRFTKPELTLNECLAVVLTVTIYAFLIWRAPSLAAGLMSGSPSMDATAPVGAAVGAAAGAAAAVAGPAAVAALKVGRAAAVGVANSATAPGRVGEDAWSTAKALGRSVGASGGGGAGATAASSSLVRSLGGSSRALGGSSAYAASRLGAAGPAVGVSAPAVYGVAAPTFGAAEG